MFKDTGKTELVNCYFHFYMITKNDQSDKYCIGIYRMSQTKSSVLPSQ